MVRQLRPNEERVSLRWPTYYAYLMGLGPTDKARAAALGITRMAANAYRTGEAMPKMGLAAEPEIPLKVRAARVGLIKALADDMAAELRRKAA